MTTKPLTQYSLLDPAVQADPFEFYTKLQQECPVYRMPETGMFVVTRFEDLAHVLRTPEDFSNDLSSQSGLQGEGAALYQDILREKGWAHVQTLQRTDPPVHTRYRKLLNKVFTGKRMKALAPSIDNRCHNLIDDFIDRGRCEFVNEFALAFPGSIIAEQIGLDPAELHRFKRWADAMLAPATRILTPDALRAAAEIEVEAQHYLAEVFAQRRASPREDIISGLVHAHAEGEPPLSDHELQNLMHQLITGGYETTTSALAHGMWLIIRYPEQAEKVRQDPSLLNNFVEESLRFESPVQGLARQTTRDVTLAGTTIPKGSMVLVRYGAANRDAAKFSNPEDFDVTREKAVTHMAFGMGVHSCVGALLARQELRSAYRALLTRMSDITFEVPLPTPATEPSLFFIPIKEMHIKFRKVGH
ncbi:MAG: cytochrome P450 [Gammaproteobacteria bacterium]|jgi:cytochrome P450|nr:cytochrome P450 [Gammaproteobacteria bacterium]